MRSRWRGLTGLLLLLLLVGAAAPGAGAPPPAPPSAPALAGSGSPSPSPGAYWPADGAVLAEPALPFAWAPVAGATSYRLIILRASDWREAYAAAGIATPAHRVPAGSLRPDTYRYTVVAELGSGGSLLTPWRQFTLLSDNPAATARQPVSPPVIQEPVRGSQVAVQELKVSWEPVAGALHYRLELYDAASGAPVLGEGKLQGSSYTIASRYLQGGRRYAFGLAAVGSAGEAWSYGAFQTAPIEYALSLSAAPARATFGQPVELTAAATPAVNVAAIRFRSARTGAEMGRIRSAAGSFRFTPRERFPYQIVAEAIDPAGRVLASRELRLPVESQLSQPDLLVSGLVIPERVEAGAALTAQWAIYNAGPAPGRSFTNYFYLRRRGGSVIPLDAWKESATANAEQEGSRLLSMPELERSTTYSLCLQVDVNGEVAEADEENNLYCSGPLTITAPPAEPEEEAPPEAPALPVLPTPGRTSPLFPGTPKGFGPWVATRTPWLVWERAEEAQAYSLVIRKHPYAARDVVYRATSSTPSLQVPPGVLDLGGWYQWQVRPINLSKQGRWTSPLYFRVSARHQVEATPTLVEATGHTWVVRVDLTLRDKYGQQPVAGESLELTASGGYLLPARGQTGPDGRLTAWLSFSPHAPSTRLFLKATTGETQYDLELFPPGTPGRDLWNSHRLERLLAENLGQAAEQAARADGLAKALCQEPPCQAEVKKAVLLTWLHGAATSARWNLAERSDWRGVVFQWRWNQEQVTDTDLRQILLGAVGKAVVTAAGLSPDEGAAVLARYAQADDPAARRGLAMGMDFTDKVPRDR